MCSWTQRQTVPTLDSMINEGREQWKRSQVVKGTDQKYSLSSLDCVSVAACRHNNRIGGRQRFRLAGEVSEFL